MEESPCNIKPCKRQSNNYNVTTLFETRFANEQ